MLDLVESFIQNLVVTSTCQKFRSIARSPILNRFFHYFLLIYRMKAETNKSSSSEQGATSNPYLAHPGNSRNYDNKPSHQRIQLSAKRSSDAILGRRTGPSLTKVTRPKSRNEAPSRGKLPPGLYGNYVHYYTFVSCKLSYLTTKTMSLIML